MAVISNIYRALTEFLVCAPKRWGEVMFKFLGGIHPNDGKRLAMDSAIEQMPIPKTLVVPMGQHIGAPCTPCVKPGDTVKKGQLIGTSEAFMHADIHSPTSGTVKKVAPMPHSGMGSCMAVVIESDGEDTWADGLPLSRDWQQMDPDEILSAIQKAGIVGMGGATFPAHIKLKPAKPVDVLILNGAECEPYLTADYRLMLEEPEKIVTGTEILKKLLSVKNAYIGIEDNKPEAIKKMKEAVKGHDGIEVAALRTKYPQGAEKMLIKSITDREVPTGGLPMDVGAAVQNGRRDEGHTTHRAYHDRIGRCGEVTEKHPCKDRHDIPRDDSICRRFQGRAFKTPGGRPDDGYGAVDTRRASDERLIRHTRTHEEAH